LLLEYLENVVTHGTGGNAAIDGYRVAGKTGTAQKPIPGIGYRAGKYIASFMAIMPVDNPQLAILAIIDEPQGSIYGGSVAAPITREVGRRAMQYMKILPSVIPTTPSSSANVAPHAQP
jgi:stage V sporulation protein D (sporulation-specific penicillin-binding protein)